MKKLLLFILALTLMFSLAACNDEPDAPLPSPSAEVSSESPDASPSAADDEPTYEVIMQWESPDKEHTIYPEGEEPKYFYDKPLLEFVPSRVYGGVQLYIGDIAYINEWEFSLICGICDMEGNIITAPIYSLARTIEFDGKEWYCVYLNSSKPVLIESEYGYTYHKYADGLIISKDGTEMRDYDLTDTYYNYSSYEDSCVNVGETKTLASGVVVSCPDYGTVNVTFTDGAITCISCRELPESSNLLLITDDGVAIYTPAGVRLTKPEWGYHVVPLANTALLSVYSNNGNALCDTDGNIIKKGDFGNIYDTSYAYADDYLSQYDSELQRYCISDLNGEPISDFIFEYITYLADDLFLARLSTGYAITDVYGNPISPLFYEMDSDSDHVYFRAEGTNLYSVYDCSANLLFRFEFDHSIYPLWNDGESFLFYYYDDAYGHLIVSERGETVVDYSDFEFDYSIEKLYTLDIANGLIRTYTPDGKLLTTVYSHALQSGEFFY